MGSESKKVKAIKTSKANETKVKVTVTVKQNQNQTNKIKPRRLLFQFRLQCRHGGEQIFVP